MNHYEICDIVCEEIGHISGTYPTIREHYILSQFGLDSIDIVELFTRLERRLELEGCKGLYKLASPLTTIGDLICYLYDATHTINRSC